MLIIYSPSYNSHRTHTRSNWTLSLSSHSPFSDCKSRDRNVDFPETKLKMEEAPVTRPFMMGPASSMSPPGADGGQQQSVYSVPGVLQFIKQEFGRFERERASWDVERAELQVALRVVPH